jgi:hypothetical protein
MANVNKQIARLVLRRVEELVAKIGKVIAEINPKDLYGRYLAMSKVLTQYTLDMLMPEDDDGIALMAHVLEVMSSRQMPNIVKGKAERG